MNIVIYKEILTDSSDINILISKKNKRSLHTKCYKQVWVHLLVNNSRLYIYIEDTILCTYRFSKFGYKETYYINQNNIVNNVNLLGQDETIMLYEVMNQKTTFSNFIQKLLNLYLYS